MLLKTLIKFVRVPINLITILLGAIVVGLLGLSQCATKNVAEITPLNTAQGEELKITVQDRRVTVQTPTGSDSKYVPEGGKATVVLTTDSTVELQVKSMGFMMRPVVGTLLTKQSYFVLGAQVYYWNRLEIYGGASYPWAAWVGAGYRLDQIRLNNTSVYVAYNTRKEIGGGLLLRF